MLRRCHFNTWLSTFYPDAGLTFQLDVDAIYIFDLIPYNCEYAFNFKIHLYSWNKLSFLKNYMLQDV